MLLNLRLSVCLLRGCVSVRALAKIELATSNTLVFYINTTQDRSFSVYKEGAMPRSDQGSQPPGVRTDPSVASLAVSLEGSYLELTCRLHDLSQGETAQGRTIIHA